MKMIEVLSLDLSNYCSKGCDFCYNHSNREGATMWTTEEVASFAMDCINNGVKSISLGGGEPFEYEGIFEVIESLYPHCYLSITTNGLPLEDDKIWSKLSAVKPDKIHVTIHHPNDECEVERVISQIKRLPRIGIKSGVNLLVSSHNLEYAKRVYSLLIKYLLPDQIILIPQRYSKTPTAKELAYVTGGKPFQGPSCLLKCVKPNNFVSVSWDKRVNYCSYDSGKQQLESLTYEGVINSLKRVVWKSCQQHR